MTNDTPITEDELKQLETNEALLGDGTWSKHDFDELDVPTHERAIIANHLNAVPRLIAEVRRLRVFETVWNDPIALHYNLLRDSSKLTKNQLLHLLGNLEGWPQWTQEQVNELNANQSRPDMHPYTCGSGDRRDEAHKAFQALHGGDFGQLVATRYGWICPACDYTQEWAHGMPDLRTPQPEQLPAPKVVVTPGTCGGAPRLDGTRLTTRLLYQWYKSSGVDGALSAFPHLTPEHVMAAVDFEEVMQQLSTTPPEATEKGGG